MSVTPLFFSLSRIGFVVVLLFGVLPQLRAQSFYDYIRRYEVGFGGLYSQSDIYDLYQGERVPGQRLHTVTGGISLSVGLHLPIVEMGEAMAVGINPDVQMFVGAAPYDPALPLEIENLNQSGGILHFAFPIFATFKYGTDATMRPATSAGLGVGLGYRPVINTGADYSYATPVAMGEVSFLVADVLVKLRATAPLTAGNPVDEVDIRAYDFSLFILPGK